MKKAVQFGAGNIGRGFIGALLSQSGYHVVFADVVDKIIDKINEDKTYTVHVMDVECERSENRKHQWCKILQSQKAVDESQSC